MNEISNPKIAYVLCNLFNKICDIHLHQVSNYLCLKWPESVYTQGQYKNTICLYVRMYVCNGEREVGSCGAV